MNIFLSKKWLTVINFVIVLYFLIIYLMYVYKIDHVVIGVFREILSIPFLLAQVFFLFYGIFFLVREKKTYFWLIISLIFLLISFILTMGSFF